MMREREAEGMDRGIPPINVDCEIGGWGRRDPCAQRESPCHIGILA